MKIPILFAGCTGILLLGCAQFQNQIDLSQPHGVLNIVPLTDSPVACRVFKVDGLPVQEGRSYRVVPGLHQVTVRCVETVVQRYQPAEVTIFQAGNPGRDTQRNATLDMPAYGSPTVSGAVPMGQQGLNMNVENRIVRYLTNAVNVEVGYRYDLVGDSMTKVPLASNVSSSPSP